MWSLASGYTWAYASASVALRMSRRSDDRQLVKYSTREGDAGTVTDLPGATMDHHYAGLRHVSDEIRAGVIEDF